jgi:hypothetical protein
MGQTLNLTPQTGLDPVLLVYDNSGQLQWKRGGNALADNTDVVKSDNGNKLVYYSHSFTADLPSLSVKTGTSYYFVVGAHDSKSTGNYSLTINQLPSLMQLSGSNLSINGNQLGANANETLRINTDNQGRIQVTLNDQTAQFEPWQISSITVNSLGGTNTINVDALPKSVSLALNLSNANTVNFSGNGLNLDQIQGLVSIKGNPASLVITLFDQLGSGSRTYGMTSNALSLPDGDNVSLPAQVTSVTLGTATSANVVNVEASPAALITINDFSANGVVNVSPVSQNVGGINLLNVEGNGGVSLTINDQANPGVPKALFNPSTLYTVNGSSLTRTVSSPVFHGLSTATTTIDYFGLSTLTLNAGNNGPNSIDVEGTSVPTNVNGGNATGQIDVAPTTQNLDYIAGALQVYGGPNSPLNIYDQGNPHGASTGVPTIYTVGLGTITRTVAYTKSSAPIVALIDVRNVQNLTLDTSKSPNQVTVAGTPAPMTINSGAADTITVTAYSQLTVNADGGTLTVDDRGTKNTDNGTTIDTYSAAFTITGQAIVRKEHQHEVEFLDDPNLPPSSTKRKIYVILDTDFTPQTLNYNNVTALTLDGGPIDTTVNVQSTLAGMPLIVNTSKGFREATIGSKGGGTVNQFIVGANGSVKNIHSQLTLNGSGPSDTLLVDDSQATTQDKVTVTPTQVGAGAADQFFAPGGSLTYGGLSSLTLNLSHAIDDVVQFTPSATTAVSINGDPTEFLAVRGAVLNLDLTGIADALMTSSGPGAGTWTFTKGSHQPVTFKNVGAVHTH